METVEALKSSSDPEKQKSVPEFYSESLGDFGRMMNSK